MHNSITRQKQPFAGVLQNRFYQKPRNIQKRDMCLRFFLIKLHALRSTTLLKRDSSAGVFLGILRNFQSSKRQPPKMVNLIILWSWRLKGKEYLF